MPSKAKAKPKPASRSSKTKKKTIKKKAVKKKVAAKKKTVKKTAGARATKKKPARTAAAKKKPARAGKTTKKAQRPAAKKKAAATRTAKDSRKPAARKTAKPREVEAKEKTTPKAAAPETRPAKAKTRSRKRRSSRREPRTYTPGELVLPGGAMNPDEVLYFLRGCVAAEAPSGEAGIVEIVTKRGEDAPLTPEELSESLDQLAERFEEGALEPQIPNRTAGPKETFASIVERARHRRREIGAFLRGLDIGGTETSHMDPHGEASLQSLMEWAARLEVLTEADQPPQTDFVPFHRVLDQLELNTESLILDVEQTLRRLRRHAS